MEVTGKPRIENIEQVKSNMIKLKEIGIGFITLDDFGFGYSSFSNLTHLPLDIVKIDSFFVEKLESYKYKQMNLDLIALIKNQGLKVIIEGIETEKQFECLVKMGFDYFQGFLFSKPEENLSNVLNIGDTIELSS